MAERLELDVVTPERRVLHAEVEEVTAPGVLGEFGVLPGHVPFVTALAPGVVTYRAPQEAGARAMAVGKGFVEIAHDRVTVLVETAEPAEEIDTARAETARERAARRLRELAAESPEVTEAQAAFHRAEARLTAASKVLR